MHPYRDNLSGPLQEGVLASCSQVPVRDQRSLPGSGVILLDDEAKSLVIMLRSAVVSVASGGEQIPGTAGQVQDCQNIPSRL